MDVRDSLTVRTVTALQRLADLEVRGRNLTGPRALVLKTALSELETALEELRVASEQLNLTVDELAEAHADANKVDAQFRDFRNVLPIACIFTDDAGIITEANVAAGELLNVSPRHLNAKPLSLYIVERDQFFSLFNNVRLTTDSAAAELSIRPRERRARPMTVQVRGLPEMNSWCWFLQERAVAPEDSP